MTHWTPTPPLPTRRTVQRLAALALLGWPALQAAAPAAGPGPIRVGMSAAFTGASAGLGTEYYRGARALIDEVNATGGVGGRRIELIALDDAYQPEKTIENTIQLIRKEQVFTLFNYVGTPTLTAALPVLKSYEKDRLVLLGNLTGAQIQRDLLYGKSVFNVRASYRQEMEAMVDRLWAMGIRKFGVFYQIDAYGRSGTDAVARALAARGGRIKAEATYRRGAKFGDDMSSAVKHLQAADVEVVLCTGAYAGIGAFVRSARDGGFTVPITNLSFVSSDNLLSLLQDAGKTAGRDYTRALLNTQVVPTYDNVALPAVAQYRALMAKWRPQVPAALRDATYTPRDLSFVGLEGFLNAKVLVQGLRGTGGKLERSAFYASLERLSSFDLGTGARVSFTPGHHQGLDKVYFTTVKGGRWVPIQDWNDAVRP
ncbi:ABC transporter substrate-binding protein [Deinococcus koreensis]|uniref:ABC transporter substrate-binding protein n=1 Tax=Deinococcus koreensis TaxID=2054903 RepID=A0A2K3USU8_9DEIO|nr:ABC transporter substrate-binding protein [Deinococcus koreensis]PNY79623.1 ABC transporter substrate-binding protein [Deinococcus koreensis]